MRNAPQIRVPLSTWGRGRVRYLRSRRQGTWVEAVLPVYFAQVHTVKHVTGMRGRQRGHPLITQSMSRWALRWLYLYDCWVYVCVYVIMCLTVFLRPKRADATDRRWPFSKSLLRSRNDSRLTKILSESPLVSLGKTNCAVSSARESGEATTSCGRTGRCALISSRCASRAWTCNRTK